MRYAQDSLFEKVWSEGLRVAALSATLGALLWGWFALTLSPVQRYYFPAYVMSSLHMTNGSEPDQVSWLVKTKPKNKIDFAEPEDLVPTTQGAAPFTLSAHAIEQGWREVRALKPMGYQGGSQAVILQDSFFGGRSLGRLFLQPMEMLALPFTLWAGFVRWRSRRDRERPPSWAWDSKKTSWAGDLNEFAGEMFGSVKFCAVTGWRGGVQVSRSAVKTWRERESVSPSVEAIPEKKVVAAMELKPTPVAAVPSTKPHPKAPVASPSAPQPVAAEPNQTAELPRAQTLPFRQQRAAESGEKWDESKWID